MKKSVSKKKSASAKMTADEKKIKVLSTIMMLSGAIVWLFTTSTGKITSDIVKGIGIFLFIVGTIVLSKVEKPQTKTQKVVIWTMAIVSLILFIVGVVVFFIL